MNTCLTIGQMFKAARLGRFDMDTDRTHGTKVGVFDFYGVTFLVLAELNPKLWHFTVDNFEFLQENIKFVVCSNKKGGKRRCRNYTQCLYRS